MIAREADPMIARAHAGPDLWDVRVALDGRACTHSIAAARALAAELLAAADRAEKEQAIEVALLLAERVWLFLSRLTWWHPRGIADDLGATPEGVLSALQQLADEGKVENIGGVASGAWSAKRPHPRARIDEAYAGTGEESSR